MKYRTLCGAFSLALFFLPQFFLHRSLKNKAILLKIHWMPARIRPVFSSAAGREVRVLHLHVHQVIFNTCLVLLCLFYFNKQKGTHSLRCSHSLSHPGCSKGPMVSINRAAEWNSHPPVHQRALSASCQ